MRQLKNRLGRILLILAACAAFGTAAAHMYLEENETRLITYSKTVATGDTVWSICSRIATDKEDMGKLVWQTMKDNHIENPGDLQPGQEIIIRVKEARKL